jgi:hypothetical protein
MVSHLSDRDSSHTSPPGIDGISKQWKTKTIAFDGTPLAAVTARRRGLRQESIKAS